MAIDDDDDDDDAPHDANARDEDNVDDVKTSKRALKRERKRMNAETRKKQRKALEKDEKVAKRERRRKEFDLEVEKMGDDERQRFFEERRERTNAKRVEERERRELRKKQLLSRYQCVMDCEFSHLMSSDKEWTSLCHQFRFVYERNCKTSTPMKLTFTGVQGAFASHLKRIIGGFDNWHVATHEKPMREALGAEERAKLVYLTADSDVELTTLSPEKIYVIGAIVDRNRHKLLTLNKAKELGIAHARLPIKDHLKMHGTSVLTVNQTFDILVNHLESGDWGDAVAAAVPRRKTAPSDARDVAVAPSVATTQHASQTIEPLVTGEYSD